MSMKKKIALIISLFCCTVINAQNSNKYLQSIYDSCLLRHLNYSLKGKGRNAIDSLFIIRKNENYKGSFETKYTNALLEYLNDAEIYKLASHKPTDIISFSAPVITDTSIVIYIVDFVVKKVRKDFYDFINYGGSRHVIQYNCSTGKFEIMFSKESQY